MKIAEEEKLRLEEIYQKFLHDERMMALEKIPMHRGSNVYLHTFKVIKRAFKIAQRTWKKIDPEVLLYSCLFHDYYLYDWRVEKEKLKGHGKNHPYISSRNAKEEFGINETVQRNIETHMWPLNFTHPPKTNEARLLCDADKQIAIKEFLQTRKHKAKSRERYLKFISKLFD